jgi:hypothetical protein
MKVLLTRDKSSSSNWNVKASDEDSENEGFVLPG